MPISNKMLRRLAATLPLIALSPAAQAESLATRISLDHTQLDEVIVSGGLAPIEAAEYGRAASVVTADEIAKRGLQTVQDVLRALPGVSVTSSGASHTQVRIRGGEGNHTLVLMDGLRLPSGVDEYYFAGLDTADIERVEVLRGPQSAQFGSNASSGVINIITRKAQGSGHGGRIQLGNGEKLDAYVERRGTQGGLRFSVTDHHDKGYDFSGKGGEKDFTRRKGLRLNGDWRVNEALAFSATLSRSTEKFAYDDVDYGATSAESYLRDTTGAESRRIETLGALQMQIGRDSDRLLHTLQISEGRFKTRNTGTDWDSSRNRTLSYRATYGLDGPAMSAAQKLYVMAEHQSDRNSFSPDYKRKQNSIAAEYRGTFASGLSLQFGLRHDQNDKFDDFTGYTLAASLPLTETLRLHGSAGRASVNPTYLEIFGNPAWGSLPNPNLKPERNQSVDIGVEYSSLDGRSKIDLTAFSERLTNEIASSYDPAAGGWSNRNIDGTGKRRGLELSARHEVNSQLSFGMSYTYLDATQGHGGISLLRPRNEMALQIGWTSADEALSLNGHLRHASGKFDTHWFSGPTYGTVHELPRLTTVDLSGRYRLTEQISLTAQVNNLMDKTTYDAWGYVNQGRRVWLGLSANF